MITVKKDDVTYTVRDEIMASAFLSSGYEVVEQVAPKQKAKDKGKQQGLDL